MRLKKIIIRTLVVTGILLVAAAVFAFAFPQKIFCVDSGDVKGDVIVVLGGGTERPQRAAELYKQHVAPRIIVSGYGDAEMARHELIAAGVPRTAIELENKSRTTRENALFTGKLLHAEKVKRAVIVTSWYHSRRALHTFRHFVPGVEFYSKPSYFGFKRANWSPIFRRHVYWEYLKLPGYWVVYGVFPF